MNAEAITVIDRSMTEALQLSRDAMDLELSPIRRAISQAACLDTLRKTISEHPEVMNVITGLQGSPLGFLTDKDKANGYPASTLADCAIEAMARGLALTGNEFNIIGGRCYVTKSGMKRLLGTLGVKHAVTCGLPQMAGDAVVIPVDLQWEYNGEKKTKRLEIPTRQNAGMGIDALQGKAIRKARAWLYEHITGLEAVEGDVESAAETVKPSKSPIIDAVASAPALTPAREYPALRQALADKGLNYTMDEVTEIVQRYGLTNVEEGYMVKHLDWLIAKLREGSANA
jgi:hypothetical protein